MADPILTDIYRAQVRVPGRTNLPHDVFVNTFGFRNDQGPDNPSPLAPITAMLAAFYTILRPFLSTTQAVWEAATVKVYDLGQPPPREPQEAPLGIQAPTTANGLPGEVACCLSYYAERNLPRRRGRVYIGPLALSTMTQSTQAVWPSDTFRDGMLSAGANLIESTENATWGVISATDLAFYPITNLWCDNAFDTQRRRGREPTGRRVWPTV